MTPDPVPDAVMRAVRSSSTARTAPECTCPRCFEERARETAAEDWRRLAGGGPA